MLHVHKSNILGKKKDDYKGLRCELEDFYNGKYLPMKQSMEAIRFADGEVNAFCDASNILNKYYNEALAFQQEYKIDTRSKFLSTIYEELNVYLFRDHPAIVDGKFEIFNKGIYAGLKVVDGSNISVITKDVDFCIGKKIDVIIGGSTPTHIILPIVCVEVKTYLDATMFGEVKASSKSIRSATPNSKAYVLMGYKDLADNHIIAARQDSTLNEMFVLRKDRSSPIDGMVLMEYWDEITNAIDSIFDPIAIETPGRLIAPDRGQKRDPISKK